MNIQLDDKSAASLRYIDGKAKVTFHGLNNVAYLLPKGFEPNLDFLNRLYKALKAKGIQNANVH
jgi:hypothetical protein